MSSKKTNSLKTSKGNPNTWYVIVLVAITALFTFSSTKGGELNYDDERYIANNELIENVDVGAIFSTYFDGHYHPLTLLSLAIDRTVFNDDIKGHHTVNWLLHLANAVLAYLFLLALFKNRKLAFAVALLFALHPMTVESYAWMTERKNVLYSFFFLAGAIFYQRYTEKPSWGTMGIVFTLFALSMLSKAQAMMLIPVMFLADYVNSRDFRQTRIYIEKLPFIMVAVIFVFLTSSAQLEYWGDLNTSGYSQVEKIFLASSAFFQYVFKGIFPLDLTAYYPYPRDNAMELMWYHYASPLFLVAFIAAGYWAFRKSKQVFFGLAFFFFNIILMLKFLDVPYGNYIMANRYNYLPVIGLMTAVVPALFYLGDKISSSKQAGIAAVLVVGILYGTMSYNRIKVWNNSVDLWTDIIEDYPNFVHAYNTRALAYIAEGRNEEAVTDFREIMVLNPEFPDSYLNLAILHFKLNRHQEALKVAEEGVQKFPEDARISNVAATVQNKLGMHEKALVNINRAIELEPENEEYQISKAQLLIAQGNVSEAEAILKQISDNQRARQMLSALKSLNQKPPAQGGQDNFKTLIDQGTNLAMGGNLDEAIRTFNRAIAIRPQDPVGYLNRGSTFGRMRSYEAAEQDILKALKLDPDNAQGYYLMGAVYMDLNQKPQACSYFRRAIELGWDLRPDLRQYCATP